MDLDVTFFIQAFLIMTALVVLGPVLFNPMLELMDLREKSIAGAKLESERLLDSTREKELALERQLEDARRGALVERQKLINEGRDAEKQLLDKARADAQTKIDSARTSLQASSKQAAEKLQTQAKDLATQIAAKLLARDVA